MCLRFHGEERPTMKQVEMALQSMRTKRSGHCHPLPENYEEIQLAERTRADGAESSWQPLPTNIGGEHCGRCYSMEREFMSSAEAELPREHGI
ncbi:hypothetical protein EJB05_40573, partial [Eragrostis curvula]